MASTVTIKNVAPGGIPINSTRGVFDGLRSDLRGATLLARVEGPNNDPAADGHEVDSRPRPTRGSIFRTLSTVGISGPNHCADCPDAELIRRLLPIIPVVDRCLGKGYQRRGRGRRMTCGTTAAVALDVGTKRWQTEILT